MKRLIIILGALSLLALPSVASASTVGGSYTFDPNPPGPSFGNPALLPDVTLSVSYDSSGTLTISETGASSLYPNGFAPLDQIEIDGTSSAGVNDWDLDGSDPAPGLTDSSINGGLAPQVTQTASTLSATYSDPALANQHFALVTVTPDTTWVPNSTAFQFYFPDADPTVSLPDPGPQKTHPTVRGNSGIVLVATETGLALGDPFSEIDYSVSGLPPECVASPDTDDNGNATEDIGCSDSTNTVPRGWGSRIVQRTYNVTATAVGTFNLGTQQTAPATVVFPWTIGVQQLYRLPPKPVKVPTGFGKANVKAAVILDTGDGSGELGGATKHKIVRRLKHPTDLGHIRWTSYTQNSARGVAVQWGLWDPQKLRSFGADRFWKAEGKAVVQLSRPRNGVFTRMTVTSHFKGRQYVSTWKAASYRGDWYWSF